VHPDQYRQSVRNSVCEPSGEQVARETADRHITNMNKRPQMPPASQGLGYAEAELCIAVSEQRTVLGALYERLNASGLLKPSDPGGACKTGQDVVPSTISQRILDRTADVRNQTAWIQEMIQRLDV